jgi:hypothetical protein
MFTKIADAPDVTFKHYFTADIVRAIWTLVLVLSGLAFVYGQVSAIREHIGFGWWLLGTLLQIMLMGLLLMVIRLWCERAIVLFNIANDAKEIMLSAKRREEQESARSKAPVAQIYQEQP